MRLILTMTFVLFLGLLSNSQTVYTSHKGSRLFPGHLHIVITVDSSKLRYEVFNHWYSGAYAECRQMTIPIDSLQKFNLTNDSIKIQIFKNKISVKDKKYRLNRNVRHGKLCCTPDYMRKISYACYLTSRQPTIRHFELYTREDLKLNEEEFRKLVLDNFNKKIK